METTLESAPEVSAPSSPKTPQGDGRLPKNFDDLKRKGRGVKPGAKRGSYHKGYGGAPAAAESVEAPAPAFTPESLRPLVCLPFDLAFIKTGWTGFPLTDNEAATLSHTGAMVANQWVQIDPKWVALITFSLSLASITAAKIIGFKQALIAHAAAAAEAEAKKKAGETVAPEKQVI